MKSSDGNNSEEASPAPQNKNIFARRKSICGESYDPEKDDDNEQPLVHPKTDSQRQRLTESVSGILLFRCLEIEQINQVIDAMFERHVVAGEHLIEQGDDGDNFYVVERGTYNVLKSFEKNKPPQIVNTFANKGFFGELALMYNVPRAATVQAVTDGIVWAMDRKSFRHIVLKSAFRKRRLYENLLESVPMLKCLDNYERINLADVLVTKSYNPGECIIQEGDIADGIFFIEEGMVKVTIKKNGKEKDVGKLTSGKYFGEKALVENSKRSASVYAVDKVKVAFLDRHSFERMLGPCIDIMKRAMKSYKKSSS